jgi:hypothetical protein
MSPSGMRSDLLTDKLSDMLAVCRFGSSCDAESSCSGRNRKETNSFKDRHRCLIHGHPAPRTLRFMTMETCAVVPTLFHCICAVVSA